MAKIELPKLLSSDEIKLDQDSIKKSLTALDLQVHNNAVQCLMHCMEHRDTSLMVRLLTEIIDADTTGYRRQGLIAWMKYFSPMRLSGKTVNMSGKVDKDGKSVEQPFDVEKAYATPFWKLTREAPAILRPIYQQGVLGAINKAIRDFEEAVANTNDKGEPIDKERPFYKGKNAPTLVNFATEVKKLAAIVPSDSTKDVDTAQKKQAEIANAA
jgi:hypothetical protein